MISNSEIIQRHNGDLEQILFLESGDKRIMLTAPAGCGKTTTLISKIVKTIINREIKPYQHILCMSFSVNAAMNLKKSVHYQLLNMLGNDAKDYENKIDVSNYHNFSISLIKKYGYLIDDVLKEIDKFTICDDSTLNDYIGLELEYKKIVTQFNELLKVQDFSGFDGAFNNYSSFVKVKLLPQKIITYNGMLVLAYELLENSSINKFYNNYYGLIAIDEFQDTNYLQYKLAQKLFDINKVYVLGDSCQKIYGFMGAIDNLFDICYKKYNMVKMEFKTNHRTHNPKLLDYCNGIREVLITGKPVFDRPLACNVKKCDDYKDISNNLLSIYDNLEGNDNLAIIVRANAHGDFISSFLEKKGIEYFDGRFGDIDNDYKEFHNIIELVINSFDSINRKNSNQILEKVGFLAKNKKISYYDSLMMLLDVCLKDLLENYSVNQRKNQILLIVSAYGLKHYMEKIKNRVFLITAHAAKGLEWDNVYIPLLNSYTFPINCKLCKNNYGLLCARSESCLERDFSLISEELLVYYVAVTRARKNLYLSYSTINDRGWNAYKSCFLSIKNTVEDEY